MSMQLEGQPQMMGDSPESVYRVADFYRYAAAASATLFAILMVVAVSFALANPDGSFGRPVLAAVVSGAVLGAFFVGSLVSWRWACVSTLIAGADHVSYTGIFVHKKLEYDQVIRLKWRAYGSGEIIIDDRCVRLSLDLNTYAARDRPAIVEQLRTGIPEEVQQGWDQFQGVYEALVEDQDTKSETLERAMSIGTTFLVAILMGYISGILGC